MTTINYEFLFGLLLVVMCGVVGIYASWSNVRSAKGPKEKAFVRRSCVITFLAITTLLALMYYLPSPYRYLVLIPYLALVPAFIYRSVTRRQMIRILEDRERAGKEESVPDCLDKTTKVE